MLLRYLTLREQQKAIGKTVEFTVLRDGASERRRGVLKRISRGTVWVGAACYLTAEVLPTLRTVEERVDG